MNPPINHHFSWFFPELLWFFSAPNPQRLRVLPLRQLLHHGAQVDTSGGAIHARQLLHGCPWWRTPTGIHMV